jgi:hypothetical protein
MNEMKMENEGTNTQQDSAHETWSLPLLLFTLLLQTGKVHYVLSSKSRNTNDIT